MEENTAEGSGGGNKNKILMIVIIALLVVLIGAIAFVAVMVMSLPGQDGGNQSQFYAPDLRIEEQAFLELSRAISTNIRGETGNSHVFSANFIISVDNTQGRDSQNIIELLGASDSILRSVALRVVRGRTFEELSHPDAMSILEQEILDQLRHEFGSPLIHRVMIGGDWFVD
ncbi:MAG: flagellar basal body-associated FliL family protein [Defluviitaleaceae bacterium]|nr:flagellar basal body-associated FliL family protein [Defluviitaleaceae bacterium]